MLRLAFLMNTVSRFGMSVKAKVRHTSDPVSWYSVEVELTVQNQLMLQYYFSPIGV